ncbi:flagellar hook-associated protein FlgL [Citrobacter sp. JGM124]|uniref:flagellar hook-associated protein FlgL n=1 Tax=Citrobacter sp. JGM124 TaxID=2799789 RepID=UPI001BA6F756|nr:flagellar hook-associated protein FlgL [Citrobacter sp. JGM124]MBS0847642.1 flagellar hook-associated protein FlgL [Citrobacter sp. JGM124]
MRISTQMMYEQNMRGVTTAQSSWLASGEQLASGNRVNRPSDDPIVAAQAVVLSQAQSQNSQYTLARSFATQKVSLEENVLGQVSSAIISAQGKIVNANNASLSDSDRASIATDLEGVRNQLLNLANSTDGNGRYIFGGYKTESAPFDDQTGGVKYVGGDTSITQQVDSARTMTVGHTGDKIFTVTDKSSDDGSRTDSSLFDMLDSAISALKKPLDTLNDSELDAVNKTSRGLSKSLDNVLTVRAELGTQLAELSSLDDLGSERALGQDTQMKTLTGVDWNSVISDYMMKKDALQASYKAFSDMQGMSLFQMNS